MLQVPTSCSHDLHLRCRCHRPEWACPNVAQNRKAHYSGIRGADGQKRPSDSTPCSVFPCKFSFALRFGFLVLVRFVALIFFARNPHTLSLLLQKYLESHPDYEVYTNQGQEVYYSDYSCDEKIADSAHGPPNIALAEPAPDELPQCPVSSANITISKQRTTNFS